MNATSPTFRREALNSATETDGKVSRSSMSNTEHRFVEPNRHVVEVPDTFAIARWSRDADVATIARCILGTLKYEPHVADTTALRHALEGVIEDASRRVTLQKQEGTTAATNPSLIANEES
jgi:hypothetical protein